MKATRLFQALTLTLALSSMALVGCATTGSTKKNCEACKAAAGSSCDACTSAGSCCAKKS